MSGEGYRSRPRSTPQQQVTAYIFWSLALVGGVSALARVLREDPDLAAVAVTAAVSVALVEIGRRTRAGSRAATLVALVLATAVAGLTLLALLQTGSLPATLQFALMLYVAISAFLAWRSSRNVG